MTGLDLTLPSGADPMNLPPQQHLGLEPTPLSPTTLAQPDEHPAYLAERQRLEQTRQAREDAFLADFRLSLKSNPKAVGEAQQAARKLGLPTAAVEANIDVAKEVLRQRDMRDRELWKTHPILMRTLQDREFLRLAHDDLDNLAATDTVFAMMGRKWEAGRATNERGYLGARMAAGLVSQEDKDRRAELDAIIQNAARDSGFIASTTEVLGQMSGTLPQALAAGGAAAGVASLGGPVTAGTAFTYGFGTALFTQSALIEGGNAYLDMLDQGVEQDKAAVLAMGVGLVNGALELAGAKVVAKPFQMATRNIVRRAVGGLTQETAGKAFGSFVVEYAKSVGAEVSTEVLQEVTNMVAEAVGRPDGQPEPSWGEIRGRLGDIFTKTAQSMSVLGLPGSVAHYYSQAQRASQALDRAEAFQRQVELSAESKVREAHPEQFEGYAQLVSEQAKATDLFVGSEKFVQAMDAAGVTRADLQAKQPELFQQLEKAEENADLQMDVVIRNSAFQAKLAKTPLGDALMEHVRFEQDGMSMAEAQEWVAEQKNLAKEAGSLVAEKRELDTAFQDSAAKVEESLYQQIQATKTLPAKESRAAAQFYRDFVVTQAARRGLLPEEFQARYPLRVQKGDGTRAAGQLEQRAVDTPEFKAWFGDSKVVDAEGKPLVVYHGTARAFDTFNVRGLGAWFTSQPDVAGSYSEIATRAASDGAAQVIPVHLSIKNPAPSEAIFDAYQDAKKANVAKGGAVAFVREKLEAQGYDGIVDGKGVDAAYVAFRPEQIKSVNNRGTFDPNDPNILRQNATDGQLEQRAVDTPEFKAWFRGSRVVDSDGKPRVVYHGTPTPGFTEFKHKPDVRGGSRAPDSDQGYFFTDSPQLASMFTWQRGDRTGGTMPVYLSMTNPLVTDYVVIPSGLHEFRNILKKAKKDGYDGVIARIEAAGSQHEVLVAFEPTQIKSVNNRGTFDPNDPNILRQDAKGGFIPESMTMLLHEKADVSTFLHEAAHAFLTIYGDLAAQGDAQATADLQTLLDWFGVKDVAAWNAMSLEQQRKHHEKFAYSFEGYLFDGTAPSEAMQGLFDRFKVWLRRVYKTIRDSIGAAYRQEFGEDLPILTGEVRGVMDRMLASEEAIAEAEAVRSMAPLFQTQEQSGMDDAKWAAYKQEAERARDAAVASLEKDSLRQMQWLDRARGRVLKQLQREHDTVRKRVRKEVAVEVMRQPEYAIQRFIRSGELVEADGTVVKVDTEDDRRLSRRAVYQYLGLSMPAESAPKLRKGKSLAQFIRDAGGINWESWQTFPGEQGTEFRPKGLVRRKGGGGIAWDYMADAAREEGYGPQGITRDEDDYHWFIDAIADAAGGQHEYSSINAAAATHQEQDRNAPPTEAERKKQLRTEIKAEDKERAKRRELLKPFRGLLVTDGGTSPDLMAEAFAEYGLTSGEQVIRMLADAAPLGEAIDARTDERMLAEHSELADPEVREAAVERALHNEARARFVAAELRHLAGATQPVRLMLAAAKAAAKETIQGLPVREVSAKRFAQAEARAARQAMEALRKGDSALAVQWQQKRLLQHALATEAGKVQAEVDKALRGFQKLRLPDEKVAKTRSVPLVNAARWILSRYNLGTPGQQATAENALEAVQAYDPALFERLKPLLFAAQKDGQDYRNLSVEQFRDLAAKVDGLWFQAKRGNEIIADGKAIARDAVKQEILATLAPRLEGKGGKPRALTKGEKNKRSFGSIRAALTHVESLVLKWDGGKPGALHRYLFHLIRDPFDSYQLEKNRLVKAVFDRATQLPNLHGAKIDASQPGEIAYTFKDRGELISALLHAGNKHNLEVNGLGRGWFARPAKGQPVDVSGFWRFVQRAVDEGKLTLADLYFVQYVWDLFEKDLKPTVQKAHFENYGYYMDEVEAVPFALRFGGETVNFRGGYYPAKADPDWVDAQPGQVSTDGVTESAGAFLDRHPSTGKGFTITRVEGVERPLLQDIRLVAQAFDEELRFAYLQRPGRDISSLLNDPEIAAAIRAIDPNALQETFRPWLNDTMHNRVMAPGGHPVLNRFLVALRRNVGLATMFGNVPNALQQPTGLATAALYVPMRFLRASAANFARAPRETAARVTALSKFMRLRLENQIGQLVDDMDVLVEPTKLGQTQAWFRRNGYFLQRMFQNPVDIISWTAAFDQAVTEGKTEKQAVTWADTVVRRSQGSGTAADISKAERAGAIGRLLTQFGTFWLSQLNTVLGREGLPSQARAAAMAVGVAGVVAGAIAQALRGGWDDEDDDGALWDDVTGWAFSEAARTAASTFVPFVGPSAIQIATGERGGRFTPGASVGAVESAGRALRSLGRVAMDPERDLRGQDIKDAATLLSLLLGIPLTAPARPASYGFDMATGQVQPSGAVDAARGLVTGAVAPGTRQ